MRSRYSKQRERRIIRAVEDGITQARIAVLRGALEGLNERGKEKALRELLTGLPGAAAYAYRASEHDEDCDNA